MAGNTITDVNSTNAETTKDIESPYGKFAYSGNFEGLKFTASPNLIKSIEAGLNWFITNDKEEQIVILKHLYESDLLYLKDKSNTGGNYDNLEKVFSDAGGATLDNLKLSPAPPTIIDVEVLKQLPMITVTSVNDDPEFIYNFNEPYKLSPYIIPSSLFNSPDENSKNDFKAQVIAFEGITTKYTYIFYNVDFVKINDDIGTDTLWNDPSDITISSYSKLVSNDNKFTADAQGKPTTTPKVGTIILKTKNSFGLVVLSDKFEAIDPLLIVSDVGKEPTVSTTTSTSVTANQGSSTTTGTTGGCNCTYPKIGRKTTVKVLIKKKSGDVYSPVDQLNNNIHDQNIKQGLIERATRIQSQYENFDVLSNFIDCLTSYSRTTQGLGGFIDDSYPENTDTTVVNASPNSKFGTPMVQKVAPYTRNDYNSVLPRYNQVKDALINNIKSFNNQFQNQGYTIIPQLESDGSGFGQNDSTLVSRIPDIKATYKTDVQNCFPPKTA